MTCHHCARPINPPHHRNVRLPSGEVVAVHISCRDKLVREGKAVEAS